MYFFFIYWISVNIWFGYKWYRYSGLNKVNFFIKKKKVIGDMWIIVDLFRI